MKNRVKQLSWALLLLVAIVSCRPQEIDNYSLNELHTITSDMVTFSKTPDTTSPNVITFTNTSNLPDNEYVVTWDLGNGTTKTGKINSITGEYPFAGDYTVTLTVMNNNSSVTRSEVVHIADNDFGLIDTPNYRALTGGVDNVDGKTWVFDQYHAGHFGVGPSKPDLGDTMSPSWWSAPVNAKEGSSLYTQEFTFFQSGTKLVWKNNGYIYTNSAGVRGLGNPSGVIENPGGVGDFDVPYTPNASYTFTLNEADMTLELSDGAFFGHYTGSSTFTIVSLTEEELYVRIDSKVEPDNRWWYRLVPKELNVAPPEVVKEPKAAPLDETFETSPLKLTFVAEDLGDNSGVVDNPVPLPINESAKVYRYRKTDAFYSNLSWVAADYKFDLTKQNKIKVKAFIPSYNDYTTEHSVAGDWISNKKLLPQLAIKLQNSEHPAPWETQTEIVKANLEKDKWIELTFDFSGVAARTDYDKIVIQFGGEGHSGQGFFFFDDFTFTE